MLALMQIVLTTCVHSAASGVTSWPRPTGNRLLLAPARSARARTHRLIYYLPDQMDRQTVTTVKQWTPRKPSWRPSATGESISCQPVSACEYRMSCDIAIALDFISDLRPPSIQVALLWQRDRATRLSVEILQLTKHPI